MTFKTAGLITVLSLIPLLISSVLKDASCPSGKEYGSDSNLYWDLAENIHTQHTLRFSGAAGYPGVGVHSQSHGMIDDLCILPAYPGLLSAFVPLGRTRGPYVLAYLLYLLLSLLFFALLELLFEPALSKSQRWAWFLIYQILNPTWIVQLRATGQDLMAAVAIAFFVWTLLHAWRSDRLSVKNSAGIVLATAAAVSIRTNVLAFILPVLLGFGVLLFKHKRFKLMALPLAGLLVASCLAGLWGVHIKRLTGRFALGSNMGYAMYVNYVTRIASPAIVETQVKAITQAFDRELAFTQDVNGASVHAAAAFQQAAAAFISAHPRNALKATAHNLKDTFIGRDYFWLPQLIMLRLRHKPLELYAERPYAEQTRGLSAGKAALVFTAQLFFYAVYIFVPALALFLGLRKVDVLGVFCAGAICFLLTTGLVIGQARYRMPVELIFYFSVIRLFCATYALKSASPRGEPIS